MPPAWLSCLVLIVQDLNELNITRASQGHLQWWCISVVHATVTRNRRCKEWIHSRKQTISCRCSIASKISVSGWYWQGAGEHRPNITMFLVSETCRAATSLDYRKLAYSLFTLTKTSRSIDPPWRVGSYKQKFDMLFQWQGNSSTIYTNKLRNFWVWTSFVTASWRWWVYSSVGFIIISTSRLLCSVR